MSQYEFVPTIISRFAATSLLLYDVILTMDLEITHVWGTKWSVPKLLYMFIRYPGLVSQLFSCIVSVFPLWDTLSWIRNVQLYVNHPTRFPLFFLILATGSGGYS
ncbi:hypothetical protein CALCODRAFT_74490 [Calocera cornea HHB12733]|uniref:DUF6533 domain-containing protein n=1 Tax=Calocera cornea HHB12733 TaxID=1353952 RepID=A0A165DI29_9BASI|nr:hypothetical protein CALCODRAFT_74490 [Calocera cornea HHB12733]